jgi:hypothetical protein
MSETEKHIITAEEVANYVVCPEAWRLKYLHRAKTQYTERSKHAGELRKEWSKAHDLSLTLKAYAKIAYLLLVGLVIVVFLLDQHRGSNKRQQELPKIEKLSGGER